MLGDATLSASGGEVVVAGDASAGALAFDRDVTLTSGTAVTGVTTIQGSTGLRLERGVANGGVLELDGAGDAVVTGDLRVTGRLELTYDAPRTFDDEGIYDLGVSADEGLCALTELIVLYIGNDARSGCTVRLNASDDWEIQVSHGSSGDRTSCAVRCVDF